MSVIVTHFLSSIIGIKSRFGSEKGATAVEYGLLVALIAAVIVVIVSTLGTQINTAFTTVSNELP